MKNKIFRLFFILSLCFWDASSAYARQHAPEVPTPLRVAVINGQAPHIYLENNEIRGEEGLSLHSALVKSHFAPDYEYFPSIRAIERLRKGQVDAAVNIQEDSLPFAYRSTFSYVFENCAVTKGSKKIHLANAKDFAGLRVVAFKNAKVSLGQKVSSQIVSTANSYQEIQEVEARIRLLKAERTDVMLTERSVFLYHLEKLGLGAPANFNMHCFFQPNRYFLFFGSEALRDQFDNFYKK
ncbi:MAG: hypothetical protein HUU57_15325 [Bdellovibrio sp.]|nr:hypothetical protein [Bdellovibrio sp.]